MIIRKSSIFLLSVSLSGCAVGPIAAVGVSSIAVTEATGKGLVDHTMSIAGGQDCRIARYLKDQQVCQDRPVSPDQSQALVTTSSSGNSINKMEEAFNQRIKQNGIKSH